MLRIALLSVASCFAALPRSVSAQAPVSEGQQVASKDIESRPWRLQTALDLPEWLELSGYIRVRFESLSDRIRAGQSGHDKMFALKSSLVGTAHVSEKVRVTAEMLDSRALDIEADATLNTGIVNAVELLQAYVGLRFDGVLAEGDKLDVQLGRHTMDVGSRRLVARNRFRNTINNFTGVNATWSDPESRHSVRAFAVLPVQRLPGDQAGMRDNDIRFDEERDQTRFFGLHGIVPVEDMIADAYVLHLDEDDESGVRTRNRQLTTFGGRFLRKPSVGQFHFELESALQVGESRASTSAADTTDLDHFAQFYHATIGYQFEGEYQTQLELLFDYVSGDNNPNDGDNDRFDTLFGARRFEFGPTGIFGPFARSNLISPGLRSKFRYDDRTKVMIAGRLHYLAAKRDAWTTTGIRDPSGNAGSYIGGLAEFRVRRQLIPKNLDLEFGYAHLFGGSFIDDAPNATGEDDTDYGYVTLTLRF